MISSSWAWPIRDGKIVRPHWSLHRSYRDEGWEIWMKRLPKNHDAFSHLSSFLEKLWNDDETCCHCSEFPSIKRKKNQAGSARFERHSSGPHVIVVLKYSNSIANRPQSRSALYSWSLPTFVAHVTCFWHIQVLSIYTSTRSFSSARMIHQCVATYMGESCLTPETRKWVSLLRK